MQAIIDAIIASVEPQHTVTCSSAITLTPWRRVKSDAMVSRKACVP
jgi:hypothetical protein